MAFATDAVIVSYCTAQPLVAFGAFGALPLDEDWMSRICTGQCLWAVARGFDPAGGFY